MTEVERAKERRRYHKRKWNGDATAVATRWREATLSAILLKIKCMEEEESTKPHEAKALLHLFTELRWMSEKEYAKLWELFAQTLLGKRVQNLNISTDGD